MITYTTLTDESLDSTHLQGQLKGVTFTQLERAFGHASFVKNDGPREGWHKTDAEWAIQFHDAADTVATIYNWKNGTNYLGEDGLDAEDITIWSVGGHSPDALKRVQEVLEAKETFIC